MKIAILVVIGLLLGLLGGAALGIGAGLGWVDMIHSGDFGGASGTLVFFVFMPVGAVFGAITGATVFGILARRESEIVMEAKRERQP